MKSNPIKSIFLILLIIGLSASIIYVLNKSYIDTAQKEIKEITSETYNEAAKAEIQFNDIVKITGTPDLLHQVSQEPTNDKDEEGKKNIYYYVGLEEYGYDFIVKVKKGKVISESQTFTGKVIGLSQSEFGTRIKNSLNKPINFDDSVNKTISKELDDESMKQIADRSTAKFTDSTFLVLDGEVVNLDGIYSNIVIYTTLLSLFLITFFRKKVFPGLNKR